MTLAHVGGPLRLPGFLDDMAANLGMAAGLDGCACWFKLKARSLYLCRVKHVNSLKELRPIDPLVAWPAYWSQ